MLWKGVCCNEFLLLYDGVKADNSIVDYHKVTDF